MKLNLTLFVLCLLILSSCKNTNQTLPQTLSQTDMTNTEQYYKDKLTKEEYYVLREKGTERPFTGTYNDFYQDGTYSCKACDQKLFESDTKFDAHCGWPSFDQAIKGSVEYIEDRTHGMIRTEVVCSKCKSHLGHVFEDGPEQTTGMRYCMNSISLKFENQNK